jgi:hypothetical protein
MNHLKAEITKVMATLKNGKIAGPDYIPGETINADTETDVTILIGKVNNVLKVATLRKQRIQSRA